MNDVTFRTQFEAGVCVLAVAAGCGTPSSGPSTHAAADGSTASVVDGDGRAQGTSNADAVSRTAGCEEVVGQWQLACGDHGYTMNDCESERSLWVGQHCDQEWSQYAGCAAATAPDCHDGNFPACDAQQRQLSACQSAFVARTKCTRIRLDEQCSEAAPFALLCLGDSPDKGCVQRGEATPGANPVCCP